MATETPSISPIAIHPELAAIACPSNAAPKVEAARRDELRDSINRNGINRPLFVWENDGQRFILDGIELFSIANELGLVAGKDYEIVEVSLPNLQAAKRWRYERAVTTKKDVPLILRCVQALELFKEEAKAWKKQARINQSKGGQGAIVKGTEKINTLTFFAKKAHVSRSTMARAKLLHHEMNRDSEAADENDRPVFSANEMAAFLGEVERGDRSLKAVAEDVKNERNRRLRRRKNGAGAGTPSKDFICDHDFDSSKASQIICGDSLELLERWAELPLGQRPQPSVIFGSPPYWLPNRTDSRKEDGKGAINYGEYFRAMYAKNGIAAWDDYVTKFLGRYIAAAYKLLPRGGRLIFQVDNTRGHDDRKNLIVFWHTDEIRRLGKQYGFIPSQEIIWRKSEISGRKQGMGSPNCPSIRSNHEYVVVLRKECNKIEGDMELRTGDLNRYAISSWDEPTLEGMSDDERTFLTSAVWDIGAARNHTHAATFPQELARRVILLFAPLDSVVLDPWNGSGTTCAAAVLTHRRFIGIDIEPYNCELALAKVHKAHQELTKIENAAADKLNGLAA